MKAFTIHEILENNLSKFFLSLSLFPFAASQSSVERLLRFVVAVNVIGIYFYFE